MSGTTHSDLVFRWERAIVDPDGKTRPYVGPRGNIKVYPGDLDAIYSYGSHFEMARVYRDADKRPSFVLVNGDTYSVSTSAHQSIVRHSATRIGRDLGIPVVIVPHSALDSAGIMRDTMRMVEVTGDRYDVVKRYAAHRADVPPNGEGVTDLDDGRVSFTVSVHRMGESTFTAAVWPRDGGVRRLAVPFLSAFDHQEARHYFLCELPREVSSVADGFEALRPAAVQAADRAGVQVTRQGDVFAIPLPEMTTRHVRKLGEASRMTPVWPSHVATDVVTDGVTTYARGTLWHKPEGWNRRPEHRRQRMGDGKVWHLIVRNTVPLDSLSAPRAWSIGGNVD